MEGEGDASAEREAKRRNLGKVAADDDDDEVDSFTPSSPLCDLGYPSDEMYREIMANSELSKAYETLRDKFRAKSARLSKDNPTQKSFTKLSCLFDDPLLPVRESGTKAVLCAAKFVIGLSSYIGGKLLKRCSGFWVDWDEENKTGIVLTTAHLILSKQMEFNSWLGKDEYAPDAKVIVHLRDDITTEGHLLYYQKHCSLALFRVRVDQPVQLPSFNDTVKCAQEVFRLGRDEKFNLKITHGRVEYSNPTVYDRYHYMYFCLQSDEFEDVNVEDGGPVIDFDGKVVGMVSGVARGPFIPCSILHKYLDLWRKFGCIPRLHFGMKFSAIKLLDPVHIEEIWRKLNIDSGLIVDDVSKGSHAEKLGIRIGDVIECLNGECISTTVELENMSLSICKNYFDQGSVLNAEVDILIKVFHTHERLRRTRGLTVKISDHEEIVERAIYPVTMMSLSQVVSGK